MFEGLISRWTRPALVGRLETVEQLEEQPGGVGDPQRTVPLALDELVQALAGDVLHHHEVDVAVVAHRERAGEVGMRTALGEIHLAAKSPQSVLFLERLAGREHLDGDVLPIVADGQVDLAHAPFAQRAEESIAPQEEPAGRSRQELAGLVGGEPAPADQLPRQPDGRIVGRQRGRAATGRTSTTSGGTSPDLATLAVKSSSRTIVLTLQSVGRHPEDPARLFGTTSGARGHPESALEESCSATAWMIRQVTLSLESLARARFLSSTAAF